MSPQRICRSIPFAPEKHEVSQFDCGHDGLNHWLTGAAAHARRMGTAGTFVWVSDGKVVGYYALAPHIVVADALPKSVGRGSPASVPSYLIGKLALDRSLQGQGAGQALLLDALIRVVSASTHIPGRLVVLDAVDENAAAFYERFGFVRCPGNELCLVMKISTATELAAGTT